MKNDKSTIADGFLVYYIKNTETKVRARLKLLESNKLEELLDRVLGDLNRGLEISNEALAYRGEEYSFSEDEFYTFSDILERGGRDFIIEDTTFFYTEEYPFKYMGEYYSLYLVNGQGTYMSIKEFTKEECHIDAIPRELEIIKATAQRECEKELEDIEQLKRGETMKVEKKEKIEVELGKVFIIGDERFVLIETKKDFAYILLKESHIKGCFLIEEEYVGAGMLEESVKVEVEEYLKEVYEV